jgi:hypothetical protein
MADTARRQLNVYVTDADGTPLANVLVLANTFSANDWGQPGMTVNPNPRTSDANGYVNFFDAPAEDCDIDEPFCIQVTAMGNATGTHFDAAEVFDGETDLDITLVAVPFV